VVGDQWETILVEGGAHVSLGDSETDSVGDTLTKRTGCDLDTLGNTCFRVTWGDGVDLSERLEVVHRDLVACEVEHNVLKGTCVTVREDESVSVVPLWVLSIVVHESGPKNVCYRSHSHGCTWVTRVGLCDDICGKNGW